MRWDERTGTPMSVYGSRSEPLDVRGLGPEAAAREYLFRNSAIFGLRRGVDVLELDRIKTFKGYTFVRFRQVFRGVPVDGASLNVALDGAGSVRMISGTVEPDLALSVGAGIPRSAASRAALEVTGALSAPDAQLVVRVEDRTPRLAWKVQVTGRTPEETSTVYLDAASGSELSRDPGIAHYNGLANVYAQDPRLPNPLLEVSLPWLAGPSALSDADLVIQNGSGSNATSTNGDFRFAPNDSLGFAQSHAYYHGHKYLDFVQASGYEGPSAAITINVNAVNLLPSLLGYFELATKQITLARQIGNLANLSFDAQIVYHEMQHYVTDDLGGIQYASGDPQALHEGLSQYAAAIVSGDPSMHDWLYHFPQCSPTFAPRSVANSVPAYHYSNFGTVHPCGYQPNQPHSNGLIIAGALWELRNSIGATITDQLYLEALPFLPSRPSLPCYWDAILQADIAFHDGNEMYPIVQIAVNRGLVCAPDFKISGPTSMFLNVEAEFVAGPTTSNCGVVPMSHFDWYRRPVCNGTPCGPWAEIETYGPESITLTEQNTGAFDLKVVAVDQFGRSDIVELRVNTYTTELKVAILGPDAVDVCLLECWSTQVTGTAPFTYYWEVNSEPLGNNTGSSFCAGLTMLSSVSVTVTDAEGQVVTENKQVSAFGDLNHCPPLVGGDEVRVRPQRTPGGRMAALLSVTERSHVELDVFDVAGRHARSAFDGMLEPGEHRVEWDPRGLARGIYFYRMKTPGRTVTERFVLLD